LRSNTFFFFPLRFCRPRRLSSYVKTPFLFLNLCVRLIADITASKTCPSFVISGVFFSPFVLSLFRAPFPFPISIPSLLRYMGACLFFSYRKPTCFFLISLQLSADSESLTSYFRFFVVFEDRAVPGTLLQPLLINAFLIVPRFFDELNFRLLFFPIAAPFLPEPAAFPINLLPPFFPPRR